MQSDAELLARFVRENSQDAFTEVVRRHINLVYSVARRQVRSPQMAEEVVQSVFVDLAQAARRSIPHRALPAWLYVVAHRTAVDAVRQDARRRARELQAVELFPMNPSPSIWQQIEPLLDNAMAALNDRDRHAIILRFMENKSLREVGAAIGASENAAQKRLTRALEQLRTHFDRRGVTVGAASLAAGLGAHALEAAPAGLFALVAAGIPAGGVTAAVTTLTMTTLNKTLLATGVVAVFGLAVYQAGNRYLDFQKSADELKQQVSDGRAREQRLRQERDELRRRENPVPPNSPTGTAPGLPDAGAESGLSDAARLSVERLQRVERFLAARPELKIPELELLDADAWRRSIQNQSSALETEDEIRQALQLVRRGAKLNFSSYVKDALKGYAGATGGMLPADIRQLAPYLDKAVDASLLERYVMLQTGALADHKGGMLIGEKPENIVDADNDTLVEMSIDGGRWDNVSRSASAFSDAMQRFSEANNGQRPEYSDQLQPFLATAVTPERLQQLWRASRTPPAVTGPGGGQLSQPPGARR